jgi:hypothetical protein
MGAWYGRTRTIQNYVGLLLYLAGGGWHSYAEIGEEFGWYCQRGSCKTASRGVRALEEAGLPIEWMKPPDEHGGWKRQFVRLPPDWVARTPWLRRYILCKETSKVVEVVQVANKLMRGVTTR